MCLERDRGAQLRRGRRGRDRHQCLLARPALGADRDHGQGRARTDPLPEQRPRPRSGTDRDLLAAGPRHGDVGGRPGPDRSGGPAGVSAVVGEVPRRKRTRTADRSAGCAPGRSIHGRSLGHGAQPLGRRPARTRRLRRPRAAAARSPPPAGRSWPKWPPGASVPFQAFLVGAPAGAKLEASAPASTPG